MRYIKNHPFTGLLLFLILLSATGYSQHEHSDIDRKVRSFLDKHGRWYDMNVPASDGKLLYDLIIEHNYQHALEIGTSTGHSTIWMAWALSKTGGKLITIEIDKQRYREALENFKEAGVEHIIDARLANAHDLVPRLQGPFDFVFSDADKGWYRNYFLDIAPKLKVNGCYTTHNISDRSGVRWNREYLEFLLEQEDYETTVDNSGGGIAISFKKPK